MYYRRRFASTLEQSSSGSLYPFGFDLRRCEDYRRLRNPVVGYATTGYRRRRRPP